MKKTLVSALAALAAFALLIGTASSAQAIPVQISVSADAYALDGSGQITSSNEFLYDSAKGDSPADAYQIAYRGNLDMTSLWSSYALFKSLWHTGSGNTSERWAEKTFSGNWDISFTVDTDVVTSDQAFVDCEALQSEVEAQNPGTDLATFIRCQSVNFDDATGEYIANFILINEDGSKVHATQLDTNQPASLHLTTPAQAFYVKQSQFEAGKTFYMTDPRVVGEMRMDAYFSPLMPLTFDSTGEEVPLTMVATYDADHMFESADPSRTLPSQVLDQLPLRKTMLVEGSSYTPPTPAATAIPVAQGVWTFAGWTPTSAVIQGSNVTFIGRWVFEVNPDAEFAVTYTFAAAGGSSLPQEVTQLLPPSTTAVQGSTVHAPTTPYGSVKTRTGTWTFSGWDPASIVIDGADVEFVGTWIFAAAPVTPPAGGKDSLANSGSSAPWGYGALAGGMLILGAASVLLGRRKLV